MSKRWPASWRSGVPTLDDIFHALAKPGRDPREELPPPIFKKGILKLEDLQPGMELKGTVLNVVDFGAFVDVGLKDSGLVHISQMANKYIKSPYDVVSVNDIVTVWVLKIDKDIESRFADDDQAGQRARAAGARCSDRRGAKGSERRRIGASVRRRAIGLRAVRRAKGKGAGRRSEEAVRRQRRIRVPRAPPRREAAPCPAAASPPAAAQAAPRAAQAEIDPGRHGGQSAVAHLERAGRLLRRQGGKGQAAAASTQGGREKGNAPRGAEAAGRGMIFSVSDASKKRFASHASSKRR